MIQIQRILVLAPHTDDAELGCGGALSRFLEEGIEIYLAAFSTAEESLPPGASPTTLKEEYLEAMRTLGIPRENTYVYDYPVRRLSYHRQEVLDELIRLRREVRPEMILLPSGSDVHQDHQTLYAEGLRAFKDITIWGYELPWNHITFSSQAFVTLGPRHLEKKWKALQAYRSQIQMGRPYFTREFLEGLARVRGVQIKTEYAESFEVIRIKW
jgi:LmbE family N-acetylglucosaminyl deacetylase